MNDSQGESFHMKSTEKNRQLCSTAARIAAIVVACLANSPARAQTKSAADDKAQAKEWADQASRLALAEAWGYDIRAGKKDGEPLKLTETPVLKWSNNYDATVFGSVFVWTRSGRPEVIASIFKFYTTRISFTAELHSLSTQPLVAQKSSAIVWQPPEAGVVFKDVPEVPAPAKTATARLAQMRDIARNFSAEVTTVISKTKHELRLMPQPLLRYGGTSPELLDGALFVFARATDPDVLLLLEAKAPAGQVPHWEFALARMHVGALAVKYRDKEVWAVEELAQPYGRKDGVYTLLQDLPEPKVE